VAVAAQASCQSLTLSVGIKGVSGGPSGPPGLIVALARKLLIALWRLAQDGLMPEVYGCIGLPDRGNALT
jgi:hypothetical protein